MDISSLKLTISSLCSDEYSICFPPLDALVQPREPRGGDPLQPSARHPQDARQVHGQPPGEDRGQEGAAGKAISVDIFRSLQNCHKTLLQPQQAKAEKEFKQAKKAFKSGKSQAEKANLEKKRKALERALEQLDKLNTQVRMRGCVTPHQGYFTQLSLELQAVDKEENKTIALGTSKLNYLDPRISVAWCKKYDVPIEKVRQACQIQHQGCQIFIIILSCRSTTRRRGRSSGGPSTWPDPTTSSE